MQDADRREPKPLPLQSHGHPARDRRGFARVPTEIACKVRRDARTVFSPGRTVNLSPSGAAVTITGPRRARVGERIAIAFEQPHCAITRAAHMITATVVRAEPVDPSGGDDQSQRLGLAFDTPQFGLGALGHPAAA